ncbi:MAG: hypothetical protein OQL19_00170 [Gammaproteobacteria bacterium]|nr:hypothetical protein [Gammaproteobacteria bacterium]
MNIKEFIKISQFSSQKELCKLLLLSFYHLRQQSIDHFTTATVYELLTKLGYPHPNQTRLKTNIKKSKLFISGKGKDSYRIHPITVEPFDSEFPSLTKTSEEIFAHNTIIDESLLQQERSFILSLIKGL